MKKSKKSNRISTFSTGKSILNELDINPKNMSSVFNRKQIISIKFNKIYRDIDLFSFRMSIDEKIVSAEVNKDEARFIPKKDFKKGRHQVKVFFKNKQNKSTEIEWFFDVIEKEIKYKLYYGIPHAHTSFSTGVGTPIEAYSKSRNRELDYLIITDHSRSLSGKGRGDLRNYRLDSKDFDKWDLTNYEAGITNKKHKKFLALAGFELSTLFFGHVNIFNSKDYINKKIRNIYMFYEWISSKKDVIVSINHPSKEVINIDYAYELDKYINFIEVANGIPSKKYMRTQDIYFEMLDKGWHLGVINSQDNHKDDWGKEENLTVVVAERLTKKSFEDAFKNRRTYSTESKTLKLKVRVNDYWMGSITNYSVGDKLKFDIDVEDKKYKIKEIQIITNGGVVIKKENKFNKKNKAIWNPEIIIDKSNSWYVVKVILENDKWGISSAIFC